MPVIAAVWSVFAVPLAKAGSESELAKDLLNPFTTLVRVPVQFGYDQRIGPESAGKLYSVNIQPVVPFALDADWTLISRTILTVTAQKDVEPGSGRQFGLGDTLQSFFISPRKLTSGGAAWGVGVAALVPTATDDMLGGKKWGLGPTAGLFRDIGPWTLGILANHIWSVAGSSSGASISSTFLQPALSYTTSDAWSFTLQTESTYDWRARQWSVPLEASVGKLTTFGKQQVSIEAGARYWVQAPESGPKGWGMFLTLSWLFPD